ncbi:MAG: amidohydrolase family protein [Pseudomonadota bacterium]
MIIDVHTHLGDILHHRGGELIFKTGVKKRLIPDLISVSEWTQYQTTPFLESLVKKLEYFLTLASQARNDTATLENAKKAMERTGVVRSVCLPLAPYVTFDDLHRAREQYEGVIPFTSVDFAQENDLDAMFLDQARRGAKGLKLHPIIQKQPLDHPRTMETVQAFSPHGLPVLFHCGVYSYYLGDEKTSKQVPEFGAAVQARELVSSFPNTTFIAGHAGLFEYRDVIRVLGPFKNLHVDVSFQSPPKIKELLKALGPERVMYGSDWPWGSRDAAAASVRKACAGDKSLENMIFYENAKRVLRLDGV